MIYDSLRKGGLSAAGACGVMGNMECESNLIPYRVQGDFSSGYTRSKEYTEQVDSGQITRDQFVHNGPGGGGYGLCQWTFYTRKLELWNMTVGNGYSISDERKQCELCINELKRDYSGLYNYLCSQDCDVTAAARRVCSEYERPAVNNYPPRIDAACRFYNKYHDEPVDPDPIPDDPGDDDQGDIIHPAHPRACYHLEYGDGCKLRGYEPQDSIKAWQALLLCWGFDIGPDGIDGQFGNDTLKATKAWQEKAKSYGADVEVNGVVDTDDWEEIIFVPTED